MGKTDSIPTQTPMHVTSVLNQRAFGERSIVGEFTFS